MPAAFDRGSNLVLFNGVATTAFIRTTVNWNAGPATLLHHEKTIRMNDAAWLYALSPDGKSIGFVGFQSGKVFTIDIASAQATEFEVPDIRPKTLIVWSSDSKKLVVSGAANLAVTSVEQAKTIQQFDIQQLEGSPGSRFGNTAFFSSDDTKIYVQNAIGNLEQMILAIDRSRQTITTFMLTPTHGIPRFNVQQGVFQHLSSGEVLSTVVRLADGEKYLGYYCYILPLEGQSAPTPFKVVMDYEHGIDGSGVMRQFIDKCLFSEPAGLTVAFCESGTKLPNVPLDVSKDKAFQTYDGLGRRMSTFGGYGAMEGNFINDFDVHPTEPWAVTTASQVSLPNGRTVGMVTIWDLRTGEALQRVETAVSVNKPIISRDGALLTAVADDGINIFRFN